MKTTFPLDSRQLAQRRRKAVFGSLLTWTVPLPVFAAWAFLGLPGWAAGLLLGGVGWGLSQFWKKELPTLEERWRQEMTTESNEEQNRLLLHQAAIFRKKNRRKAGEMLRQAVAHKKRIESSVHQSRLLPDHRERIDTLVDTLCFSLVEKLSQEEGAVEEDEILVEALNVLKKTEENVAALTGAATGLPPEKEDGLAGVTKQLKEEAHLAEAARKRLQRDLQTEGIHNTSSSV